jgi:branched-chain amino acid transport system ATP-binding protein
MAILAVEHLTKTFGELRAVDDLSMSVNEKTIVLVIGPNGSGKTTLINCIAGFCKPNHGKIFYNNIDVTNLPPHTVAKHGVVKTHQIPAPLKKLTVLENLLVSYPYNRGESLLWAPFKGAWVNHEKEALRKVMKVMELLELKDLRDKLAYELSGGQLKLLEIGRVLMNDARLLLLDEPVGSVYPVLAHGIFSYLLKLRKELGTTLLVVEHRLDIAMEYVDYVYAMANGRIICEGKPEEVISDENVTESFLGDHVCLK